MARIRCFLLEPTERVRVKLRRYSSSSNEKDGPGPCPLVGGKYSYHNASTPYQEEPVRRDEQGYITNGIGPVLPRDDPRWPQECACGYIFRKEDSWQHFSEQIYRRTDSGEEVTLRDAPPGAMWEAPWTDRFQIPQGEHNLIVKTPGGEWQIDSQANNCTMPDDRRQEQHHCWIRHGQLPDITVDKNGITCGAGAGSIQAGSYHGFLRSGYLED